MAGIFILGEEKVRPGSYFNIKKNDDDSAAAVINGVTAVIFRSDFGPAGEAVELSRDDGYEGIFGTEGTTDAMAQALAGGAKTLIACRLGSGGAASSVALKDADGGDVLTITTKYSGSKPFAVTVRESVTDNAIKECIIYSGTSEFKKATFAAGEGEVQTLAATLASTGCFLAETAEGADSATLANVVQAEFSGGEDPAVTIEDYSNALAAVEPYVFNTICVDTEDVSVHALVYSFLNRIFENGSLAQAVIAEKSSIDLEVRKSRAAAYNDEKMVYVLNDRVDAGGTVLEGYQTAARIAGMVGAVSSASSLTHTVISGFTDLLERLTPTQITKAEQKGCLVLSANSGGQIWIDSAINTLVTPAENQDKGWKKIRRVKTRFELLRRCNDVTDNLVGKVDNDSNGRKTIISQLNNVCYEMQKEGKLNFYKVAESKLYKADGDSAWFTVDVVDKDSAEHIYTTFGFQFSTAEG